MSKSEKWIDIPHELRDSLFYPDPKMILPNHPNEIFFIDELFFYLNETKDIPWKNPEKHLSILVEQWDLISKRLQSMLSVRDRGVKPVLMQALSIFLKYLFWSNEKPVKLHNLDEAVQPLSIKPVNVEERLCFIIDNTSYFHSYKQLSELMNEQIKHIAKRTAISKIQKK